MLDINVERAQTIEAKIAQRGQDVRENVVDALTDIAHLCEWAGEDFGGLLDLAKEHFEREGGHYV